MCPGGESDFFFFFYLAYRSFVFAEFDIRNCLPLYIVLRMCRGNIVTVEENWEPSDGSCSRNRAPYPEAKNKMKIK